MKKRAFELYIKTAIDKGKKEKAIYDNGLDLINFLDDYFKINNILLKSIYGEEASDLIDDFITDSIYDDIEKEHYKYIIYDSENNIIADCSTLDTLYEYVETLRLELIESKYSYDIKTPMSKDYQLNLIKQMFSK